MPELPDKVTKLRDAVNDYCGTRLGGGPLHITLDDGNMEAHHIEFCREEAKKYDDTYGQAICDLLLEFTLAEREALYASNFESANPRD